GNLVAAADAAVKITRQGLGEVAAGLAAAPAEAEVASTLDAITRADEALGQARQAARTQRRDLAAAKKAREDLAVDEARAWADLRRVRRDREEAARLDEQVRAYREDEQVATELGRLLRSDRFERWLCGEALDSLVAEASVTLMELSGQQYELDRDDRNDL